MRRLKRTPGPRAWGHTHMHDETTLESASNHHTPLSTFKAYI